MKLSAVIAQLLLPVVLERKHTKISLQREKFHFSVKWQHKLSDCIATWASIVSCHVGCKNIRKILYISISIREICQNQELKTQIEAKNRRKTNKQEISLEVISPHAMELEGIDCLLITANCGSVFEDVSWRVESEYKLLWRAKIAQKSPFYFSSCNLLASMFFMNVVVPTAWTFNITRKYCW